jgi:hypothetical protein
VNEQHEVGQRSINHGFQEIPPVAVAVLYRPTKRRLYSEFR